MSDLTLAMHHRPTSLVLATTNPGKVLELRRLLADLPIQILDPRDIADVGDVDETGSSYRENAELKARAFAVETGHFALADDSGLEIEALGNLPGVRSARFAGAGTSYEVKIAKILEMLAKTGVKRRPARFVCVAALADPRGTIIHSAEGICPGSISERPTGSGGFGYDPIFVPEGYVETFGELPEDIKRQVSHRGRAVREIIRYLLDFIAV